MMLTLLAARTPALSTRILDLVVMPSAGARSLYEARDPDVSSCAVAHPATVAVKACRHISFNTWLMAFARIEMSPNSQGHCVRRQIVSHIAKDYGSAAICFR